VGAQWKRLRHRSTGTRTDGRRSDPAPTAARVAAEGIATRNACDARNAGGAAAL